MNSQSFNAQVQEALIQGNIDEALLRLLEGLKAQGQRQAYDNALLLKAKWETIKQEQLRGVIARSEYDLALNKIIAGIQSIILQIEQAPGEKPASGFRLSPLLIGIVLAGLAGGLAWYLLQDKSPPPATPQHIEKSATAPAPDNTRATPATSREAEPESKTTTSVHDNRLPDSKPPATDPARQQPAKQPKADAPPGEVVEIKMVVKKIDTQIKINGQTPEYVGPATGIVRTIRLKTGTYTIEIIEEGRVCTRSQIISETTKRIYPSCE